MGIAALKQTTNMFPSFIAIFIPLVSALPPPPEYPTPAPTQEYNPDIGQTNVGGYGVNKDPYCHMVEKVVFENQCEPYVERTCYATLRTRNLVRPSTSITALVLSKPMLSECASMSTSWSVTWLRRSTTRHWRRLTRCRGVSLARTGCATPRTRST